MREALALVGEEGLDNMWARHKRLADDLWKGLGEMGLQPFVENPDERLVTVNTIKVCAVFQLRLVCNEPPQWSQDWSGGEFAASFRSNGGCVNQRVPPWLVKSSAQRLLQ